MSATIENRMHLIKWSLHYKHPSAISNDWRMETKHTIPSQIEYLWANNRPNTHNCHIKCNHFAHTHTPIFGRNCVLAKWNLVEFTIVDIHTRFSAVRLFIHLWHHIQITFFGMRSYDAWKVSNSIINWVRERENERNKKVIAHPHSLWLKRNGN